MVEKIADELGIGKSTLKKIRYLYDNEDKIPEIIKRLEDKQFSIHKSFQGAKLVIEQWYNEKKVIDKILNGLAVLPRPRTIKYKVDNINNKIKSNNKNKCKKLQTLFCPECKKLIFTTKKVEPYTEKEIKNL